MSYEPTPPRPDPWATKAPREGMRDIDDCRIVSLAPSVNLTPIGGEMVPTPYNVMDFGGHDDAYTPTVRFTGQRAMVFRSLSQHVHGDEAGTGGGVASGTHGGVCEPIEHAGLVRAEGSPVIRHLDRCWMNDRNTVGECQFVRDTATYDPPKDADPIPGSASTAPGSQIMSDAGPDPSLSRPGAQLAYYDPQGKFTATPPSTASPPPTAPAKAPPPRTTGYGLWSRLMIFLGLAEAGGELGDMAGREYVGPDGVRGKQLSDALTNSAPSPFSPQGQQIGGALGEGGMGPIDGTNTLLSLKAGRPVDFRTMPPGEVDDLVRQPWPSAEQLARTRQALKEAREQQAEPGPAPAPAPGDSGGNVRITDDERRRRCKVGPYSEMKDVCAAQGMQAHHIVPDYALRYGNRGEAEADERRIPGLPTFGQGMSICVSGNARQPPDEQSQPGDKNREHYWAHGGDEEVSSLGNSNTPKGTLPLARIVSISVNATVAAKPECAPEITAAVAEQYRGKDPGQLGRTTQALPTGDAAQVLPHGATQDNWRTFIRRP